VARRARRLRFAGRRRRNGGVGPAERIQPIRPVKARGRGAAKFFASCSKSNAKRAGPSNFVARVPDNTIRPPFTRLRLAPVGSTAPLFRAYRILKAFVRKGMTNVTLPSFERTKRAVNERLTVSPNDQ
jgi:hypothetical protein